ncbi:MAG: hypothetical protein GXO57_09110, partial [Thermodesulfobacteria bacterium]|nr:hypothetical protein [Thermodesulfobacteriota bacterium]
HKIVTFILVSIPSCIKKLFTCIEKLFYLLPIGYILGLEMSIRKVFNKFYTTYSKSIKNFSKDRKFLRYLIFKENLEKSLDELNLNINKLNFKNIKKLLDNEIELNKGSIISKHPFLSFLTALIVAIVGGGASVKEGWVLGITPKVLIGVIFLWFISWQTLEIFRPEEVKLKELKQFILWLENDKSENGQGNNNSKA